MDEHPLSRQPGLASSAEHQMQEEPFPTGSVVTQHLSEDLAHNQEILCNHCRAVGWSCLPQMAADGLFETKNMELRPLNSTFEELRASSCRICNILSIIKPPSLNGKRYVLKALPLSRQFAYNGPQLSRAFRHKHHVPDRASRCTVLGVFAEKDRSQWCFKQPSLAVVRLDDLRTSKIAPSSIDYNKLKDIVNICEEEHQNCCAAESHLNVLGLKVINTKTQEVVKAPDQCKYLALSYVWGKQTNDDSVQDKEDSPAVIKDAISVTNSLGYSYLWVDRCCISNSEDKPWMISQMGQIYANASITIIAAADGDTEMGLSGVSKPRQLQNWVDIQDVAILELPLGHEALTSSKWASRAWTYQEGYLSTRRLIFTATQILFLCNGMYASESLQQLLKTTCCTDDTAEFKHLIPNFTVAKRRFSVHDLLNQAQEYSKRKLTHSSDSLNAFLGVLNYYTKNSASSISPVLQLPWGLIASKHAKKNAFVLHLLWSHNGSATRRSECPSWSWTGWGGPLSFWASEIILQPQHEIDEDPVSYFDWKISVREADDNIVEMYELAWKEFETRNVKHRLHQEGPKELQVSCLVIPVSFGDLDLSKDQKKHTTEITVQDTEELILVGRNLSGGFQPILEVWKGIYIVLDQADVRMDQQVEKQDCILGLISIFRSGRGYWGFYRCLLVRQVGEGLYERVGSVEFRGLDLDPNIFTPEDLPYKAESQVVFMDAKGTTLDKLTVSDRQRRYLFADTAESRTIRLV